MVRCTLVVLAGCGFAPGATPDRPDAAHAPDADAATAPDGAASWHVIETMTIDTTTTTPATSQTTLASGVAYRLRASGTFSCTFGGTPADAEYWGSPPADLATPVDFGLAIDDVTPAATKSPHWGAYTTAHVYEVSYTGHGAPLRAVLFDSQYDNNTGSLTLEILAL